MWNFKIEKSGTKKKILFFDPPPAPPTPPSTCHRGYSVGTALPNMLHLRLLKHLLTLALLQPTHAAVYLYDGVPGPNQRHGIQNTAKLNAAFRLLAPGDTLIVPNSSFWVAGGVHAHSLHDITIQLDGTLKFLPGRKAWPTQLCNMTHNPLQPKKKGTGCVQECIFIENSTQLTLTSSGTGMVRFCW